MQAAAPEKRWPSSRARYPQSRRVALDNALPMLAAARERTGASRSLLDKLLSPLGGRAPGAPALVCGDLAALPFAAATFDLVWSNLALQWVAELPRAIAEIHRVLEVGGLVTFTTFGPDTLKELRAAFTAVDAHPHVGRFTDMHDMGDLLVHAGFADPVMQMEMLTLTYADARSMTHDLKAIGATNATVGRRRGLTGRRRFERGSLRWKRCRARGGRPHPRDVRGDLRPRLEGGAAAHTGGSCDRDLRAMTRGIFVTGTDTGVGKTLVATAILRALVASGVRAVGMKPVAAGIAPGAAVSADVEALVAAGNVDASLSDVNPYSFAPAIAPHLAAAKAGVAIDLDPIAASYGAPCASRMWSSSKARAARSCRSRLRGHARHSRAARAVRSCWWSGCVWVASITRSSPRIAIAARGLRIRRLGREPDRSGDGRWRRQCFARSGLGSRRRSRSMSRGMRMECRLCASTVHRCGHSTFGATCKVRGSRAC